MRIGLLDVDGHNFPNLALMKISTYHKQLGHIVEFANAFNQYDIVYQSKIFDFTPDYPYFINAKKIIKGGTGYSLHKVLPSEIENISPDYSLYPNFKEAYGYLSRGCPRNCKFCIVGKKEGIKSIKVSNLDRFWNGQKEIKLLDPNILACKDRLDLLHQLADSKSLVDFTQGLDARLLNNDVINSLMQIKIKMIHFAWDNMKDSETIIKKLINFKLLTKFNERKLSVYVLTNFDTTIEQDLYRIYTLRDIGYTPYVMIYNKQNAPKKIKEIQRWVNNKIIFRTCKNFDDYNYLKEVQK